MNYRFQLHLQEAEEMPSVRNMLKRALLTILLGILLSLGLNLFFLVTGLSKYLQGEDVVAGMYAYGPLIEIAVYGLITPILEELLFRKLLFQILLRKKLSFLHAAVLSALIFGLYHGNPLQFCYASILGFIFALSCEAEESVIAPIRIHASLNIAAVLFTESGLLSMLSKSVYAWPVCILCILFSVPLIRMLYLPLRKE